MSTELFDSPPIKPLAEIGRGSFCRAESWGGGLEISLQAAPLKACLSGSMRSQAGCVNDRHNGATDFRRNRTSEKG